MRYDRVSGHVNITKRRMLMILLFSYASPEMLLCQKYLGQGAHSPPDSVARVNSSHRG